MANLVSCVSCKKPISATAEKCPHCGETWQCRLKCALCGDYIKPKEKFTPIRDDICEGVSMDDRVYFDGYPVFRGQSAVHKKCLAENLLNQQWSCPCCHKETIYRSLYSSLSNLVEAGAISCPNCGQPLISYSGAACCACDLVILNLLKDTYIKDFSCEYHKSCHKIAVPYRYTSSPPVQPKQTEQSSSCFVATLCYGSYDAPEVMMLRAYRDKHLAKTLWGRFFITLYYRYSPYLVSYLKNYPIVHQWIRKNLLDKIIKVIIKNKCVE